MNDVGGSDSSDRPDRSAAALAAVESHPVATKARGYGWCDAGVIESSRSDIQRWKVDGATKAAILRGLQRLPSAVVVMFHVADEEPELFAGHGLAFYICLHPETLAVVGVAEGTWRS